MENTELKFRTARVLPESVKIDTSELYFFSGVLKGMGMVEEASIIYVLANAAKPDMTMEKLALLAAETRERWEKEGDSYGF